MLPNLIIIGGQKCGTSSLHYYLGLHPEIFMSRVKELNFFTTGGNWDKGVKWYQAQFARARQARIRGESSPYYTNHPFQPGVPGRMHSVVPDARLIYLVRDPVERLLSHYHHWVASGRESLPLPQALAGFETNPYVTRSRYWLQLEQYLVFFPRSQVLILASEDLRDRRRESLRRVFRFLGVNESFDSPQFDRLRNRARDQRQKTWLGRWAGPWTNRLAARTGLPPWLRWRLDGLPYWPFSKPFTISALDERLRRDLIEFFRADVQQLRAFTGGQFARWCV